MLPKNSPEKTTLKPVKGFPDPESLDDCVDDAVALDSERVSASECSNEAEACRQNPGGQDQLRVVARRSVGTRCNEFGKGCKWVVTGSTRRRPDRPSGDDKQPI
jgi:hypothetical protein